MTATVDITEEIIYTALSNFLGSFLASSVELVRGQDNRVPEPRLGDFVVMVSAVRARMATNIETYDPSVIAPEEMALTQSTDLNIRLDVHGPHSEDNAQIITTIFRSNYATSYMSATGYALAPLYAEDPQQMPFINASQQYEDRWIVVLHLQADPTVSTPQDFADILDVTLISVDAEYPPGAQE